MLKSVGFWVTTGVLLAVAVAINASTPQSATEQKTAERERAIRGALDPYLKQKRMAEDDFLAYRHASEPEFLAIASAFIDKGATPSEAVRMTDDALKQAAAEKATPQHYYAYDDGQRHYGYSVAASDADRTNGVAARPYAMYLLSPHSTADVLEFRTASIMGQQIIRCARPCTTATQFDAMTGASHVYPVEPGTVLWALVQDGLNGQLIPAQSPLP